MAVVAARVRGRPAGSVSGREATVVGWLGAVALAAAYGLVLLVTLPSTDVIGLLCVFWG